MWIRVASALIALPIVLLLMVRGGWAFASLGIFVGAVSVYEFLEMTNPDDRRSKWVFTVLSVLILVALFGGYLDSVGMVVGLTFLPIFTLIYFLFRVGDIETVAARSALALTGVLWAGLLLGLTAALRLLPDGPAWLLLAFVLAWGSDTGAYFAGRTWGKHKLYPQISPKKTWEGSIGGVVVATGLAFGFHRVFGPNIDPEHLLIMAPLGAALGQVGDLAESMLKRSVGVKDSGRIMPGHGGLFDRVDALIFIGPCLLCYALVVLDLPLQWLSVWPIQL